MKFNNILLLAGAIFSLNLGTALANPTPPVTLKVDPNASTLEWTARKVTGKHNGFVKGLSGNVVVDGGKVTQGNFTIDLTTMTVEDIKDPGSNDRLLNHLKSDDFFSVEKHNKANFVLTSATLQSGSTYLIKGKLTIKGITNEIEFPADVVVTNNSLLATAKIKIDRTKFDIRYRSTNFFENLGDKAIFDDFDLDLKLVATL